MSTENGMPENEEVKNKAIMRLAVAGVVTAAALGGLWWLDQSSKESPEKKTPAPIASGPQTEAPVPEPEDSAAVSDEVADGVADGTDTLSPDDMDTPEANADAAVTKPAATPEDRPPPPRVTNNLGGMPRSPSPIQPAAPQLAPKPTAMPLPQAQPATQPAPMPQPATGNGFVVQLGVFSNAESARELVAKLNKLGIRAHLEARVQIGPYLNRQEAEKAQAEMRKLGYNALVTLPYTAAPATK